jgi:hypothetical protein
MGLFSLGNLFAFVGLGLLIHAAYGVMQCTHPLRLPCSGRELTTSMRLADRDMLKLMQEDFDSIPSAVVAQVYLGSILGFIGELRLLCVNRGCLS